MNEKQFSFYCVRAKSTWFLEGKKKLNCTHFLGIRLETARGDGNVPRHWK